MNRLILVGTVVVGGIIALRSLPRPSRRRLEAAAGRRLLQRMERVMASLPENSPPKLIMSTLPRLREQNDRIITMLEDQNRLLRKHLELEPEPEPDRRGA